MHYRDNKLTGLKNIKEKIKDDTMTTRTRTTRSKEEQQATNKNKQQQTTNNNKQQHTGSKHKGKIMTGSDSLCLSESSFWQPRE